MIENSFIVDMEKASGEQRENFIEFLETLGLKQKGGYKEKTAYRIIGAILINTNKKEFYGYSALSGIEIYVEIGNEVLTYRG